MEYSGICALETCHHKPVIKHMVDNCKLWGGGDYPASHLPGIVIVIVVQHNFQLTSIFLEFCQHTAGFTCPGWIFLHYRCTPTPLAIKPICCKNAFFVTYGLYCRCVACRSGMRAKAMSSACFPGM